MYEISIKEKIFTARKGKQYSIITVEGSKYWDSCSVTGGWKPEEIHFAGVFIAIFAGMASGKVENPYLLHHDIWTPFEETGGDILMFGKIR